jgi:hypothetical protein
MILQFVNGLPTSDTSAIHRNAPTLDMESACAQHGPISCHLLAIYLLLSVLLFTMLNFSSAYAVQVLTLL